MKKSESELPSAKTSLIIAAQVDNITIEAAALTTIQQNVEAAAAISNSIKESSTSNIAPVNKIQTIWTLPEASKSSKIGMTVNSTQNDSPVEAQVDRTASTAYDRNAGCVETVEIFNETRVTLVSICLFGGIFFAMSKMVNIAKSKNSGVPLNWSFLLGGIVLTISEFSMMIYLISIGFLTFFIVSRYKHEIRLAVYVAAGHINMNYEAQIILGFIIVICSLPPWLYVRDYSVQCLINRDCIFLLEIFQALSDCICGCHHACDDPLTLCQAVMLSLPSAVMALVPAVGAIYVYVNYFHHHHTIFVPYCPPPIPDPVYRFS